MLIIQKFPYTGDRRAPFTVGRQRAPGSEGGCKRCEERPRPFGQLQTGVSGNTREHPNGLWRTDRQKGKK